MVIISANVAAFRTYPENCKEEAVKAWENRKHVLHAPDTGLDEVKFNSGNNNLPSIDMLAGQEIDFYIEIDFTRPTISKDVSVVVWGDEGPVHLTHKDNVPSSSGFPIL